MIPGTAGKRDGVGSDGGPDRRGRRTGSWTDM